LQYVSLSKLTIGLFMSGKHPTTDRQTFVAQREGNFLIGGFTCEVSATEHVKDITFPIHIRLCPNDPESSDMEARASLAEKLTAALVQKTIRMLLIGEWMMVSRFILCHRQGHL
jgi:hypothetical protein